MFYSDIFINIKNTLELNILIFFLEKDWNYNCAKSKNIPLNYSTWVRIDRRSKRIETVNYFNVYNGNYPKKNNVLNLKQIKKWGPYTNNELRL